MVGNVGVMLATTVTDKEAGVAQLFADDGVKW
jgi:hypothetical protein